MSAPKKITKVSFRPSKEVATELATFKDEGRVMSHFLEKAARQLLQAEGKLGKTGKPKYGRNTPIAPDSNAGHGLALP